MKKKETWTLQQVSKLVVAKAEGKSNVELAELFGVTDDAVRLQLQRIHCLHNGSGTNHNDYYGLKDKADFASVTTKFKDFAI